MFLIWQYVSIQAMACIIHDNPTPEPMLTRLTHICSTRPQKVNSNLTCRQLSHGLCQLPKTFHYSMVSLICMHMHFHKQNVDDFQYFWATKTSISHGSHVMSCFQNTKQSGVVFYWRKNTHKYKYATILWNSRRNILHCCGKATMLYFHFLAGLY